MVGAHTTEVEWGCKLSSAYTYNSLVPTQHLSTLCICTLTVVKAAHQRRVDVAGDFHSHRTVGTVLAGWLAARSVTVAGAGCGGE